MLIHLSTVFVDNLSIFQKIAKSQQNQKNVILFIGVIVNLCILVMMLATQLMNLCNPGETVKVL